MGDDGTRAKGTRYTPEFRAKAVRLLTESRSSYSSETKAIEQVAKDPGIAPESLRRWRNEADATVAAETRQSAEEAMAELRKLRAEVAELRPRRVVGLRVPHAARLPHVQVRAREPHGRAPRGFGARPS